MESDQKSAFLQKLIRLVSGKLASGVTEDNLLHVVDAAHEHGVIEKNEAEMIQNIIDFGDKEAKDIMTHRTNIVALDVRMVLQDAMDIMTKESYSRYPVYDGSIDNIVGIIHLKDVLKALSEDDLAEMKSIRNVHGLVRPVGFIPETRNISSIFKSMKAKSVHMVIVVDEYGQTAGLVAMEDILEEIVGEIQDEYDKEEIHIHRQSEGSWLMDGQTPLDEVEKELGLMLEEEEFETLNGFLTNCLGHIPGPEDYEITAMGYRFLILSVKNNTIQQVRAEKINEEEGDRKCQDTQNLQI